jgi:protein SCO1/2
MSSAFRGSDDSAGAMSSGRSPEVNPLAAVLMWGLLVLTMLVLLGFAGAQYIRSWIAGPLPPVLGVVPPIHLMAQDGRAFSEADFQSGKQYHVIDFIFTRCGGQCPRMTQSMAELQKYLISEGWSDVHLLSVTVDPDNDTTTVLREYGERFGADFRRWSFLHGPAEKVYPWANKGLMLAAEPNPGGSLTGGEEFVHSNKFVLVDPKGRVRGYFTGTDPEDVERLKAELARLRFAGPGA